MEFLTNMFGDPIPPAVNLVLLTLGLVLALLIIFWFFRRFVGSPALKSVRGRQPRLAVTDAANLDDRRRLVLVRRDDVEHLVMIGGATDVLIESNIVRTQSAPIPKPAPAVPAIPAAAAIAPIADVAPIAPAAPVAPVNLAKEIDFTPHPTPKAPAVAAAVGGLAGVATSITGDAKAAVESVKKADPIAPIKDALKIDEPVKNVVENIKEKAEKAAEPEVDTIDLSGMEDALSEELAQNTTKTAPKVKAEVKPEPTKAAAAKKAPATAKVTTAKATDDKVEMEDEMQKLLDELAGDKT